MRTDDDTANLIQADGYPALTKRPHALDNQLELTLLKLLHVLHVERNKCRRTGDGSCTRCSANESIIVGYWLGTFSQLLHGFEFTVKLVYRPAWQLLAQQHTPVFDSVAFSRCTKIGDGKLTNGTICAVGCQLAFPGRNSKLE